MPLSEEHKKKRGKNFALAAVLVAFVILVFLGAMVQMRGG
jgi:hypothetical protein